MIELALQAILRYGEDRVEVSSDGIVVYYPELTLISENKKLKPHVMKDLYFTITDSFSIGLTRRTFLSNEFKNNYVFSHARSYGGMIIGTYFEDLCTGGDETPMSKFRRNIRINKDLDGDEAELFWLQVEKYLSYESISGTPYIKLESVVGNTSAEIHDDSGFVLAPNSAEPFKKVYNEIIKSDIKYNYRNNTVIADRDKLLELIENSEIFKTLGFTQSSYYKDGDYYNIKNNRQYSDLEIARYNQDEKYLFDFKGNNIPLVIINTSDIQFNTSVPPLLFYGILNKINQQIKNYQSCWNKVELQPYTK